MINDHLMSHGLAETPWGGFGDSGIGRTHAELGFLEMLQTRVVVDDILPGAKKDLWWQPYSEKVYRGMLSIIRLVCRAGPGRQAPRRSRRYCDSSSGIGTGAESLIRGSQVRTFLCLLVASFLTFGLSAEERTIVYEKGSGTYDIDLLDSWRCNTQSSTTVRTGCRNGAVT